jgi:hypothetical protein
MSLDVTVMMRKRLSMELFSSLQALLTREGFEKRRLGKYSFYGSTKKNIHIAIDISRNPLKDNDEYWKSAYEDGTGVDFLPKATISLESRHTKRSHLKAYSLAKVIARLVGGIIFDEQMWTAYSPKGIPLCESDDEEEDLMYGKPILPFMEWVGEVKQVLALEDGHHKERGSKG